MFEENEDCVMNTLYGDAFESQVLLPSYKPSQHGFEYADREQTKQVSDSAKFTQEESYYLTGLDLIRHRYDFPRSELSQEFMRDCGSSFLVKKENPSGRMSVEIGELTLTSLWPLIAQKLRKNGRLVSLDMKTSSFPYRGRFGDFAKSAGFCDLEHIHLRGSFQHGLWPFLESLAEYAPNLEFLFLSSKGLNFPQLISVIESGAYPTLRSLAGVNVFFSGDYALEFVSQQDIETLRGCFSSLGMNFVSFETSSMFDLEQACFDNRKGYSQSTLAAEVDVIFEGSQPYNYEDLTVVERDCSLELEIHSRLFQDRKKMAALSYLLYTDGRPINILNLIETDGFPISNLDKLFESFPKKIGTLKVQSSNFVEFDKILEGVYTGGIEVNLLTFHCPATFMQLQKSAMNLRDFPFSFASHLPVCYPDYQADYREKAYLQSYFEPFNAWFDCQTHKKKKGVDTMYGDVPQEPSPHSVEDPRINPNYVIFTHESATARVSAKFTHEVRTEHLEEYLQYLQREATGLYELDLSVNSCDEFFLEQICKKNGFPAVQKLNFRHNDFSQVDKVIQALKSCGSLPAILDLSNNKISLEVLQNSIQKLLHADETYSVELVLSQFFVPVDILDAMRERLLLMGMKISCCAAPPSKNSTGENEEESSKRPELEADEALEEARETLRGVAAPIMLPQAASSKMEEGMLLVFAKQSEAILSTMMEGQKQVGELSQENALLRHQNTELEIKLSHYDNEPCISVASSEENEAFQELQKEAIALNSKLEVLQQSNARLSSTMRLFEDTNEELKLEVEVLERQVEEWKDECADAARSYAQLRKDHRALVHEEESRAVRRDLWQKRIRWGLAFVLGLFFSFSVVLGWNLANSKMTTASSSTSKYPAVQMEWTSPLPPRLFPVPVFMENKE